MRKRDDFLGAAEALLSPPCHPVSALCNIAALLWEEMPSINWAGFYFLDRGSLWLGPFQGKIACTRIAPGRGVCGAALVSDRVLVVSDVHEFAGHIACDEASASEIVIPLHREGRAVGVLDVDSPLKGRFTEADAALLLELSRLLENRVDFTRLGFDLYLQLEHDHPADQ